MQNVTNVQKMAGSFVMVTNGDGATWSATVADFTKKLPLNTVVTQMLMYAMNVLEKGLRNETKKQYGVRQ